MSSEGKDCRRCRRWEGAAGTYDLLLAQYSADSAMAAMSPIGKSEGSLDGVQLLSPRKEDVQQVTSD